MIPSKEFYAPGRELEGDRNYQNMMKIFEEQLENMKYIDIYETLSYEDYFNNDIHWKQEELGDTITKIAESMKSEDRLQSTYEEKELYPFYGMNVKNPEEEAQGETLVYLTNEIIETSSVYHYENKTTTPVYTLEEFESKEPYGVFLSGTNPLLTINNPNTSSEKKLVIFRDSFGSSLAPLLIEAYASVTLIDLRYIASEYIGEFITFTNQDVLILNHTEIIKNSIMLK